MNTIYYAHDAMKPSRRKRHFLVNISLIIFQQTYMNIQPNHQGIGMSKLDMIPNPKHLKVPQKYQARKLIKTCQDSHTLLSEVELEIMEA
jgi:hypothetical protein